MRRAAAITLLSAFALAVPGAAPAHSGAPYWTRVKAEIVLATSGRLADAFAVACEGVGSYRDSGPRPLLALTRRYQHFMCVEVDLGLEARYFRMHVTGDKSFRIERLRLNVPIV